MNPKQEKRFWSADQKRFVYSLKEAPTGASFQKGRIKYYRIFRKIKGGDPMIVVVCPGFVGLYIPD